MNKLSICMFAAMLAFGTAAQALDDPPVGHGGPPGGPPPQPGAEGHGGGGMHDMMRQHMDMMRGHGKKEHQGYADVVLKFATELKLSNEQVGKITRLQQANQKQTEDLGPKLHETLRATHDIYLNPAADEAAIRKAAKGHSDAFDQLLEINLKARAEINAVLTVEQLKALQAKKVEPEPPPGHPAR